LPGKHLSFDGIIKRGPQGCPDQHPDASDCVSVLGVPVITFQRSNLDKGNPWIIHSFGEPRLQDKFPKLLDPGFIMQDDSPAMQVQKFRVGLILGNRDLPSDLLLSPDFCDYPMH